MPSALVEVMFISWPEEHELLKQEKTRDLAAEAIAQGILNYLDARQNPQTGIRQVSGGHLDSPVKPRSS